VDEIAHGVEDEGIEAIDAECPPMLAEALGYEGPLRHVAFWRSPAGDVLRYTDGETQGEGTLVAWLTFVEHPGVWPRLIGYGFGSGSEPARHWLLVDRQERRLSAGTPRAVARFLAASIPDEVRRRQAEQALAIQDEQLARARRRALRDRAFLDHLQHWLDARAQP
jgi:hypothetical protein